MGAAEAEALELELMTATRLSTLPLNGGAFCTSTSPLDGSADDDRGRDPLLVHKDSQSDTSYAPESASTSSTSVNLLFAALIVSALIAVPTFAGVWMRTMKRPHEEPDLTQSPPGSGGVGSGNPPQGAPSSTSPPGQWTPSLIPPVLPKYPAPLLPRRENVIRVDDFGAVGDGRTMNTEAFEKAIAAAKERSGGGTTLVVPAGKWLTGPFYLTSNFTLQLNDGATILASQTFEHYASILPFASYYDVDDPTRLQYRSFISGNDLVDVVITGTGTIDGQGDPWWEARGANASFWSAPRLVEFVNCTDIIISGVTLQNSQMWTLHPIFCSRVHIHGILLLAPNNSRNTDGINPDSSVDVLIENCRIDNGDDSISIKSGLNNFGLAVNRPSRNITIRSLTLGPGTHGLSIGSELSGGISDITVRDINFLGGGNGLRIKTAVGRGAYVRNVFYENIWIQRMKKAVILTSVYHIKRDSQPIKSYNESKLTTMENITISKLVAFDCHNGIVIAGFPALPFELNLRDVAIERAKVPWRCENVKGQMSNVRPAPPPSCSYGS